jgi:hypothetical protein
VRHRESSDFRFRLGITCKFLTSHITMWTGSVQGQVYLINIRIPWRHWRRSNYSHGTPSNAIPVTFVTRRFQVAAFYMSTEFVVCMLGGGWLRHRPPMTTSLLRSCRRCCFYFQTLKQRRRSAVGMYKAAILQLCTDISRSFTHIWALFVVEHSGIVTEF